MTRGRQQIAPALLPTPKMTFEQSRGFRLQARNQRVSGAIGFWSGGAQHRDSLNSPGRKRKPPVAKAQIW
ncbi:hypothetical protein METY_2689 [Methylopila sp. Yamaguchi]|nr:hypothetical protein METY_2689 [Methylopila sp. Yamaguchi]